MVERRNALYGSIVFAVAFLANALVFDRNFDTAAEVADWLDNNTALMYIGSVLVMIAGVGFLWFINNVRVIVANAEGDNGSYASLVLACGVLFVGLWWVSAPIDIGIAEYVGSDIDINTYDAISNIAHQQWLFSQIALAVVLVVLFVVGRRAQWPSWILWLTIALAVTSVLQLIISPLFLLLPIWAVLFAVAMRNTTHSAT